MVASRSVKIQLLATVSSLAIAATAQAADLSYPTKAPAYIPAPSWTGFYVGGNLGAAWEKWSFDDVRFDQSFEFWSDNKVGFTVGGQLGYNWQYGNFVYGIEGDLSWIDSKNDAAFAGFVTNTSTSMDWLATFRGRFGVTLTPSTLLYATGGLAVAHVKDAYSALGFESPITNNKTAAGFAAGGGVEYMFTRDWTAKLEGLYVGLPNRTVTDFRAGRTYQTEFKHSAALARIGINRKF